MSTFVLLHGGNHQARHWDRVRPLLALHGHETLAIDMPMYDVNAGVRDWADVVVDELRRLEPLDDVIVVGHSLAGLALPLIAEDFPIRRMVFLCALVPTPGTSWVEYEAAHPEAAIVPPGRTVFDDAGRFTYPWDFACDVLYHDCDPDDAADAYRLTVPCATTGINEQCAVETWPAVPSTYIVAQGDRLIGPDWSRQVSFERLGGRATELDGGHLPMLARPHDLVDVLLPLAAGD